MSEWNAYTFEEVCLKITDGAHNSPKSVENGFPMGSVKDMTEFGINIETCRKISSGDYEKLVNQGCRPQNLDILIAKDGATAIDTVCIFKGDDEIVLLSSIAILRPNTKVINPYFLKHYLSAESTKKYIKGCFTSGAAIPRVVLSDFKKCSIKIPNLKKQEKIADILSTYDNFIINNNHRITILEEMAQRLYREWFVHFRFPGHENVEMVDSEIGMIPEGWHISDVKSCCSVLRRGISPKYNDNATGIVINQKCIRNFSINLELARKQEKTFPAELQVQSGDVLINSTGVGTLGRVAQMYENVPNCTVDSHITLLRPDSNISYYVGSFFREKQASIMDMGVGSTGQTELNRDKIKVLPLLLPDYDTVCLYEEYVGNLMSIKTQLQKKNMILRKTRDHLLPRLISGDIDVSSIEL